MNWNGAELKAEARNALSKNYWRSVLVALILTMITGTAISVGSARSSASAVFNDSSSFETHSSYYIGDPDLNLDFLNDLSAEQVIGIITMVSAILVIALIISIALNLFLFGPLTVGCARYTELSIKRPADFNLGRGFSPNYWNVVKSMFIRALFVALWAILYLVVFSFVFGIVIGVAGVLGVSDGALILLLIFSVLIYLAGSFLLMLKLYDYRMIPYILASDPNMERREVFRIAKEMVKGERLNIFFLDLSFIGWIVLSILTCGILMIFYVNPYIMLTEGALFHKLSEKVGFRVDMTGNFLPPPDGYMSGNGGYNNGGYNNGGYNNGGYNNGGYNNGGYNNGGYNNGGYNNGGYNNDGYNNGGYNNSGYNNGGYNNDGYNNGGYNNDGSSNGDYNNSDFNKDGYGNGGYLNGDNNNSGYGNSDYNNSDPYNYGHGDGCNNGYGHESGGHGSNGYGSSDYSNSGYGNSGLSDGHGNSGYDNGAGFGHQPVNNYDDGPYGSTPENNNSESAENGLHTAGSICDVPDNAIENRHPSSVHDQEPKKDQNLDNIDFT